MYVFSSLFACICHIAKDITINWLRSGATSQTYTVPNSDNSAAGDYACMVTVSTIESSESSSYSIAATGILILKAFGLPNKQLKLLLLSIGNFVKYRHTVDARVLNARLTHS